MRTVIVVLCVMSLAGCVSPRQQAQRAAAVQQMDDSQCQGMGYKPGTELYLKCRTTIVQLRMQQGQVQQAQSADVAQRMQNAGAWMSAAGAPPAMPPMQQPMHCTTTPSIYGSPQYGSNTNCY
jgi:hypothetical protein